MLPKGWIQCRFSVLLGERKASISSAKYGTPGIRTSDSKQWTGPAKNTCLWARESTVFRLAKSVTYKQRAAEVFWASAAGRSGECLMIGCGLSRRIFDQSNQPSLSDSDSMLRAPCGDANCQFGATKIVASPCLPRAEVLVSVTEDMT